MKRTLLYSLYIISLLLCCNVQCIHAQKKEIAAARDNVKAGKNLSQAQSSMEKLLQDSTNRNNRKIWEILFTAVRKQYEQGNEKLYLKQAYDTANLFSNARQLFKVAAELDSIEMLPNRKGKIELEHRKGHAEYLSQIRPNLYNGGAWFLHKKRYKEAYEMFDQYIVSAHLPMFRIYDYQQNDKHLPSAAYWAVFCGYKLQDAKMTLHHSYEALKDTAHYNYMLQYLAETYKLEKDTMRYAETLKEGFKRAPKFPFFFPRLVEYYVMKNQPDSAMDVVNRALAIDKDNLLYLFSKSTLLLNAGRYSESAVISEQILSRTDSAPEAYYNAGLAYYNMAAELDKNAVTSRKRRQEILDYYKKAMPFLQKYQKIQPEEVQKWGLPLYTIYLNLNMGKEFDEIDKLIQKSNK